MAVVSSSRPVAGGRVDDLEGVEPPVRQLHALELLQRDLPHLVQLPELARSGSAVDDAPLHVLEELDAASVEQLVVGGIRIAVGSLGLVVLESAD